jgi:hypothetical protein
MEKSRRNILLPKVFGKLRVVLPLHETRLTINILFQFLNERLPNPKMSLHVHEIFLHTLKELLLIDVAIQVPKGFFAAVVPNSVYILACARYVGQ